MGIPKFFRFISERWPLISSRVDEGHTPEFDNLYFDMNSILHTCTHSNDSSITSLTDDQMFGAIFAYIDHLFDIIRPKETFYMAIDGVAPRAKMNQQRARRFRTAVEAEENMAKAIKEGREIPKDPPFDSNSITPGSEFMAKLTRNLKYYINHKVSTDANWQNIKVILSGHEVPGEGEHKIMDYIRVQKSQPGYNPNTRHCIYGLDADLIMLGLVSHEPHMAILREEVTFGRNAPEKSSDLTKQTFYLLHISLVREYLALEFQELEDQITFEYDFENVLDDFILIMYVIGNDFLPNLPDLHINKGAFPLLIETFKQAMRDSDGYLNDHGTINFQRFAIWLEFLSVFELENFEKGEVDVEWFNNQLDNISRQGARKRLRQGKELLVKQQKKVVGAVREWIFKVYSEQFSVKEMMEDESKIPQLPLSNEFLESDLNKEFVGKLMNDLGLIIVHSRSKDTYTVKLDIDGIDPNQTEEGFTEKVDEIRSTIRKYQSAVIVEDEQVLEEQKDLYDAKFTAWKNKYYKSKFGFTLDDEEQIVALTQNYLEGLQWVLYYYYTGICSWPWYYKYHYSPRVSDIQRGLGLVINFEKGKPFTPFQQLMAVLPARSKDLIPPCYRSLMTDAKSPIIDFYPENCDIDMNGKKASWEAVVLLSFVDQERLIEAMDPLKHLLTPEEKQRDSFGTDLLFHFNPQIKTIIHSPLPASFADFDSHCVETVFTLPSMEGLIYNMTLCKGAKFGKESLAGFPTMKTIPIKSFGLEFANVQVFERPSKSQSMVLTIENAHKSSTVEQFAREYLDQIVYTNWPFLVEAKVVSVVDNLMRYEVAKFGNMKKVISGPLEDFEREEFEKIRRTFVQDLEGRKAVRLEPLADDEEEEATNIDDIDPDVDLPNRKSKQKQAPNPIEGLVYVRPVTGMTQKQDGSLVKTFSKNVEVFPIQLIVEEVLNKDARFAERPPIPVEQEYPVGSEVVFLGAFAYGTPAKVLGHKDGKLNLKLTKIQNQLEPDFGHVKAQQEKAAFVYRPINTVARILGLHPQFLSRITSSYMVEVPGGRRMDIGLQLKFEGKRLKVLGYSKRNDRFWEFSDLAINLIKEYQTKFPKVLNALMNYKLRSIPTAKEIFKIADPELLKKELDKINVFLKEKKSSFVTISLESEQLTKVSIADIEAKIIESIMKPQTLSTKAVSGIPAVAILNPSSSSQILKKQSFELGDRVVNVADTGKVPIFAKGTVVGIRVVDAKVMLQVLFDQPLVTGNRFDGRLQTQRGLVVTSSTLLNLSNRQFLHHSKASAQQSKGNIPDAQKKILMKKKAEKENLNKTRKELLSVINKSKDGEAEAGSSTPAPAAQQNEVPTLQPRKNGTTAKNIFNSVLQNTISSSDGSQQQHQQQQQQQQQQTFYGGPIPPMMNFSGQPAQMMYPYPQGPAVNYTPVNIQGSQELMTSLMNGVAPQPQATSTGGAPQPQATSTGGAPKKGDQKKPFKKNNRGGKGGKPAPGPQA